MKNKVNCFCDVETTGLDETTHGIWNIAFILEYEGQILEEFSIKMNPETPIDLSAFKGEIPNIKSFDFIEIVVPKIPTRIPMYSLLHSMVGITVALRIFITS